MLTLDEFHVKYNRLPTENDPDWNRELAKSASSSKMQVMDMPILAPGKCLVCGSVKPDRKYLDLGVDLDAGVNFNWVLYVCSFCVKESYNVMFPEWLDKEPGPAPVAGEINYALEQIASSVDNLLGVVQYLKEEINALGSGVNSSGAAVSESNTGIPDDETEPDDPESSGTEQGTPEQNPIRGFADLPSLDELIKTAPGKSK